MKKSFILLATLAIMLFPVFGHAQSAPVSSSVTEADVNKSLDLARNIVKVTTGIADDFIKFKGDFLQKDGSDNSYYSVKDLDMGTDVQYVIVRASGGTAYAAIFKGTDKTDKAPAMAFAAFTGGIITIKNNADISVVADDSGTASKTVLKYYLKVKDTKVASFTLDTEENKGTLLVAIQ